MAKKSAISGEYIITVEDSGAIRVCRIFDNVMGSLRECAKSIGFTVDPKWNTQDLGRKLIKEYGDGSTAEIGEYTITRTSSGHVDTYQVFGNTKRVLRTIAAGINMPVNDNWTTRQFGNKMIDFIEGTVTPDAEIEEEGFAITPDMTTLELFEAFTKEFGGHLRIKKGVKRCDPNQTVASLPEMTLAEAGMTEPITIFGDMTVAEVEALAASKGLKLDIATNDDWVAVLDDFPLDSIKSIPNSTTKAKMQEILDR